MKQLPICMFGAVLAFMACMTTIDMKKEYSDPHKGEAKSYLVKVISSEKYSNKGILSGEEYSMTTIEFPNGTRKEMSGNLGKEGEVIKIKFYNSFPNFSYYAENLGDFVYEK